MVANVTGSMSTEDIKTKYWIQRQVNRLRA